MMHVWETAPLAKFMARRIPRCHLSSEEKVLVTHALADWTASVSPDAPLLPDQKPSCKKLPRAPGMRRLPGVLSCGSKKKGPELAPGPLLGTIP